MCSVHTEQHKILGLFDIVVVSSVSLSRIKYKVHRVHDTFFNLTISQTLLYFLQHITALLLYDTKHEIHCIPA